MSRKYDWQKPFLKIERKKFEIYSRKKNLELSQVVNYCQRYLLTLGNSVIEMFK